MVLVSLFCFLIAVNILAFLAFRIDKRRAQQGQWRFSEGYLLCLALFGGWIGAKIAQRRFRHKTRKEPFRGLLNAVPFVWIIIAALPIAATMVLPPPISELRPKSPVATAQQDGTHRRSPPKFFQSVGTRP